MALKVLKNAAAAQKARSCWTSSKSYELANVDVWCVYLRNEAFRRRRRYDNLILFVGCAKRLRWLEPGGFFAALSCRHRYPAVKVSPYARRRSTRVRTRFGGKVLEPNGGTRMALDVCALPSHFRVGCMPGIC